MASYTRNLNLTVLDPEDLFNTAAALNFNMDILDTAWGQMDSRVKVISQETYDEAETHFAGTLYICMDSSNNVKFYCGDTLLKTGGGGVSAGAAALSTAGAVGFAGTAERTDE